MRRSGWQSAAVLLGVALVAAWSSVPHAQAQTAAPAAPKAQSGTAATHKPATPASPYDRALLRPALLTLKAPAAYEVKFTTTKGDFVIKVTREWAPLGADRFYNLVRHHFYDNTSFFRVLKGFVV